jgi:signal transduction histidine kinase
VVGWTLYDYEKVAGQDFEASPYTALIGSATVLVVTAVGVAMLGDPAQRGNARIVLVAAAVNAVVYIPGEPGDGSWWPVIYAAHNSTVVLAGWFLLRYPEDRVRSRVNRALLVCAAVWFPVTRFTTELVPRPWQPTPISLETFEERTGRDAVDTYLQLVGISQGSFNRLLFLAFVAALLIRLRGAPAHQRRILFPVVVPGAVLALFLAFGRLVAPSSSAVTPQEQLNVRFLVVCVLVLVLAAGVAVALTRRRLAAAPVSDLLRVLGQRDVDVQDALRRTLDDPDLGVHFWVGHPQPVIAGEPAQVGPATGQPDGPLDVPVGGAKSGIGSGYVDREGRPTTPQVRPGRSLVSVADRGGEPLAVVDVDAGLQTASELLSAAVQASALALENERLNAQVLAQLAEVRSSRARIVAAGVAERRAVERDLHDGAQQRLLALSTTLSRLGAAAGESPESSVQRELLGQARAELRACLGELRDLARGIHPAVLTQVGLRAAVESVAERMPIQVTVNIPHVRLPEAVETTVYYVVCEALTNVIKHSAATEATVSMSAPGPVTVRVSDNGQGVAAPAGLMRGSLGDRIRALGGELHVRSGAATGASSPDEGNAGTVVEAVLPTQPDDTGNSNPDDRD